MFKFTLMAFTFLGSSVFASTNRCSGLFVHGSNANTKRIQVSAPDDFPAESFSKLNMILKQTLSFFEHEFVLIHQPIEIRIGSKSSALRTGYDFKDDVLNFPEIQNIENFGLDSVDVIRHELFHLLSCRSFPKACAYDLLADRSYIRIHEALADYFAYKLSSDAYFGEHFFLGKQYVRSYSNDLTLSLTEGAHGQGNAITKYLITHKITLNQIREFLASNKFDLNTLSEMSPDLSQDIAQDLTYALNEEATNYPISPKRKYRLDTEKPLRLKFKANQSLEKAMPQLRVEWNKENGQPSSNFEITNEENNLEFTITPKAGAKSEKVIAVIYSQNKMIGYRAFYFGLDIQN